jgi:hypothetical protein
MNGFIDRLPTWARDLAFALIAANLAWAGDDLAPVLQEQPGWVSTLAAPILLVLVGAATKWTRAYGRGSSEPREVNPPVPAARDRW